MKGCFMKKIIAMTLMSLLSVSAAFAGGEKVLCGRPDELNTTIENLSKATHKAYEIKLLSMSEKITNYTSESITKVCVVVVEK